MGKIWMISLLGISTLCCLQAAAFAQSGSASATLSLVVPVRAAALAQQPDFLNLAVSKAFINTPEETAVLAHTSTKTEKETYQLWVHL